VSVDATDEVTTAASYALSNHFYEYFW